jgi:co-chaperonin GroES (HSP10)
MKTPRNSVLINIEKRIEDSVELAGQKVHLYDGEDPFTDGSYNPEERKRIWGIVVATPVELSAHLSNIVPEIKVGDKVYFHYLLNDPMNMVVVEGKRCLNIPYDKVFCAVREGKIIPVAGWMFISKVEQEVKALEFSTKKEVKNVGIVSYLPAPYIGEEEDLEISDKIAFENNLEFENEVEGKKFYLIKREYIICKLQEQL